MNNNYKYKFYYYCDLWKTEAHLYEGLVVVAFYRERYCALKQTRQLLISLYHAHIYDLIAIGIK